MKGSLESPEKQLAALRASRAQPPDSRTMAQEDPSLEAICSPVSNHALKMYLAFSHKEPF